MYSVSAAKPVSENVGTGHVLLDDYAVPFNVIELVIERVDVIPRSRSIWCRGSAVATRFWG